MRDVAAGDQRALRALVDRSHRIVFTLIMRLTGDRESAEELTLDVFQDVWRRAASYDPANGTVVGWIMNQARSRAIDRHRWESRKKRVGPTLAEAGLGPAAAAGPPEAFEVREQGRVLRAALETLAPAERQAIETAYFSGLTYAEVATRLATPLGTVKTRIRAGLEKLRRALAGERGS